MVERQAEAPFRQAEGLTAPRISRIEQ